MLGCEPVDGKRVTKIEVRFEKGDEEWNDETNLAGERSGRRDERVIGGLQGADFSGEGVLMEQGETEGQSGER